MEGIAQTLIRETGEKLGLDISDEMNKVEYLYTFKEELHGSKGKSIENEFFDVFCLMLDVALTDLTLQKEEMKRAVFVDFDKFKQAITQRNPSL